MSLYINNQSTKNFIGTNKTSKRSIKQDNLTTLNYATLMVEAIALLISLHVQEFPLVSPSSP